MNQRFWLTCLFASAIAAGATGASAATRHKPGADANKKVHQATGAGVQHGSVKKGKHVAHASTKRKQPAREADRAASKPETPQLTGDLAAVKEAIDLARKANIADATTVAGTINDPAGRKLVEWFVLRHPDSSANFGRYAAFVADNPDWPGIAAMRRRAEARLWQERSDAATVHGFTRDQPLSAKGRFALARVLLADGDREGAARQVREAWRSEELSERSEADAFEAFRDLLTRDDHRARMDKRIGAKDLAGAMRAAKRLGDAEVSIVKACSAGGSDKAIDKLDDVASEARLDLGYTLCRIRWTMGHDRLAEATRLMLAAAPETMVQQDTDEWWRVRRTLARKLLDLGEFQNAYQVVSAAAPPANEYYRSDFHFMSGWIALRYLNEPATARAHFAHIDEASPNPTVVSRANYWRGRAAEALGDSAAMRASFEAAARCPTAYYGQLARARLGLDRLELRPPLQAGPAIASATTDELVRAADMLYAVGERDTVVSFVSGLAEQSVDVASLAALGELTVRRSDARAMLQIGKTALARGLALDIYAFPTIGIPEHKQIAPEIERSVIYSVARTESAFDQKDKSAANAVGLMQVTPEAGRDTAKRFGVSYDWDRMVSDPVYNTQMGAGELSALLQEYRGSHIMTFAGYNAGRGRVRDWVKAYGDPRDPNVDPVDWVERIPFSETRNYVQRVMENLQIYRMRFEASGTAMTKYEQPHPAAQEANSAPVAKAP